MVTPLKPKNRLLYVLLGVTAALVVLSVVLVLSRGTAPALDPATPEGTVQQYTQALLAGDDAGAASLLTDSSAFNEECQYSRSELHAADLRLTLGSTTLGPGTATVAVSITQGAATGPFGTGESSYSESFKLTGSAGSWSILSAPWPLLACTDSAAK